MIVIETHIETKPKVHKEGRICKWKACNTKLNKYNGNKYCSIHQPVITIQNMEQYYKNVYDWKTKKERKQCLK